MSDQFDRVLHGPKPSASRTCNDPDLIKLVPKKSDRAPKIITGDTEDNQKGVTYMTNFFDGENHYTFRSTEAAIEWLIDLSGQYKKGIEVWFANVQYDIGNLFRESQENLSFTIAGSRFITGKVYKERIKFKDILNVIPGASVKRLGKMINFEKIEVDGDYNNVEYCQRDTEIVYWALLKFKNTLSKLNVELKNTAAGTGFTALLKQFPLLQVNNLTESDHEFMKRGYYGGRTEVFNTAKHKGSIYGYDIISCYPDALRHIPIIDTNSKIYTTRPNINKYEGFCDCVVRAPDDISIPYLPFRSDNKLIFPRGVFRGVWTYFELREAKKLGYKIIKNYSAIEFRSRFDFGLDHFINKLFTARRTAQLDGDTVLDHACKIILNSCYGKLAMGNERTDLAAFDEFHKFKGNFSSEVFPNNQIIIKTIDSHAPSTNFLTAALTTAYARHKLYNYLIKADTTGTLLYCDTDSVFLKGDKLKDTPKKPGLGDMELKDIITEAQFVLPKTYFLKFADGGEIYKCKGVWGELAKKYFTDGHVEKLQPLKYIETCRKNFQIKHRNDKYSENVKYLPFNLWVSKTKAKKSDYTKRIVLKNGLTRPITLNYDIETDDYIN